MHSDGVSNAGPLAVVQVFYHQNPLAVSIHKKLSPDVTKWRYQLSLYLACAKATTSLNFSEVLAL